MKRNVSLIIPAAGESKRFFGGQSSQGRVGKVFQDLAGKPLLAHTLDSFESIPQIREILIIVQPGTEAWVKDNFLKEWVKGPVRVVAGGATRAESVLNALRKTSPESQWVAVHDGARPFPPKETLRELFEKSHEADAVILGRSVVPTLKRVSPGNGYVTETVDRSGLFEAETPQLVRRSVLLKAYESQSCALQATDEASLVESVGGRVKILSHSGWNVKVTTPEDLRLAKATLSAGSPTLRIGFGKDMHRLMKGRKLYLGGVLIPFKKGALGHSDGDVLLHSISDAVLGALGLGDIGDWFSDKDPKNKNLRSEKILEKILDAAEKKGWVPSQVDSVMILEKPKLGLLKKKIKTHLAKLLKLNEEYVSIKAKTAEGLGPEGEGLAVTCEAVVTMKRVSQ